jgi:uncharacterized protein (TIGR02453 family)
MKFTGFRPEGLEFLERIAADNSKRTFEENRTAYERGLLAPAKSFVVALGEELRPVAPGVHAEPRVNGSIFRQNRDTRFSKDKRPYKTHLDLFFWEGAGRSRECPGFFFRLTPTRVVLGAGLHHFDRKNLLERYREAVGADGTGEALERALAQAKGTELGGVAYKRVPPGFDPTHPRAELLKHDGLFVWTDYALPGTVTSARFVRWCATRLEPLAPVHRWLVSLTSSTQAAVDVTE